jgi:hypothetical protein
MININCVWIRRYLTMHSFLRIQSFPPWVRKKHRLRVRSSHRPAFSGERFLAKQTAPDTEIVDVRIRSLSGNIDMRPVTRNKCALPFIRLLQSPNISSQNSTFCFQCCLALMPRTEMGTFLESPRAEWRERLCCASRGEQYGS